METLFWACLIGGIIFAVVSVVFGDIISHGIDGALDFLSMESWAWLQPMTLVGGITVFGGAGLLLHRHSTFGAAAVIALAVLAAVIVSTCVYFLYVKPMQNSENSTAFSIQDMEGKIAEVLVPIPSNGYGEVLVRIGSAGVTNQIAASYNDQPIPGNANVVVVEVREGILYVALLDMYEK
ncbi:protease [Paenibacillaceae bacterium]|nr:protease [Paenibacillaceae bacterium]